MCAPAHAGLGGHVYNNEFIYLKHLKIFIDVKNQLKKQLFFRKYFAVSKIVSTFALAFEKCTFS